MGVNAEIPEPDRLVKEKVDLHPLQFLKPQTICSPDELTKRNTAHVVMEIPSRPWPICFDLLTFLYDVRDVIKHHYT